MYLYCYTELQPDAHLANGELVQQAVEPHEVDNAATAHRVSNEEYG